MLSITGIKHIKALPYITFFTYQRKQLYFFANLTIISKGGDVNVLLLRWT